jgi:hypothetical protein
VAHDPVPLAVLKLLSNQTSRRFLFHAMLRRHLSHNFCRIAFLAALVCLCSCEANFFGPDSREIAGGYRLKRVGDPNQFSITIPNESGGLIIDEIGWRKPFIVARASGSEYWDIINTARAQHTRVSDLQRKSDPVYQSIQIEAAELAWTNLNRYKRLW